MLVPFLKSEVGLVTLEVLVSTMHQSDLEIVNRMNIRTDAIIINQCDRNDYLQYEDGAKRIKMYSFDEKGVGLSRNSALMRATADICLMADDDVVYDDGYENVVLDAFKNNPRADMIMFNVPTLNKDRKDDLNIQSHARVNFTNFMRYGTYCIAFRRESVIRANIYFSLLFGGGAKYACGEDTIFIADCLKKGLKIYSNPARIGTVKQEESTWFKGYNEEYFFDRGVLHKNLFKRLSALINVQFAIRKYNLYKSDMDFWGAIRHMNRGSREWEI